MNATSPSPIAAARLFDRPSRQILAGLGFLSLLLILGFAHTQWEARGYLLERAEREAANAAVILSQHATDTFAGVNATLQALIPLHANAVAGGVDTSVIHRELKAIQLASPAVRSISWADAAGNRTASSVDEFPAFLNVARLESFRVHRDGRTDRPYIGPSRSSRTGDDIIPMSIRLVAPDGGFAGVATGLVDPAYFKRLYDAVRLGSSQVITLFRDDGRLLIQNPGIAGGSDETGAEREIFTGRLKEAPAATYRVVGKEPMATPYVVSYARVPGEPLVVAVRLSEADALTEFWTDFTRDLAMVVLALGLVGVVGYLLVTQAGRYESVRNALAASEARAQLAHTRLVDAVESLEDGIMLWDRSDVLVMHNEAALEPLFKSREFCKPGVSFQDALSKWIEAGVVVQALRREEEYIRWRTAQHQRATGERIEQKLSNGRWVSIRERQTREGGVISIRTDITEQKRAEEALRHSRDLLENAGQLAKVGGWELDLETDALTWTTETYRIHGIDPDTKMSRERALAPYSEEMRVKAREAVDRSVANNTPIDLELSLTTADGHQRHVRSRGHVEFRDGTAVRIVGVVQDLTERKLMEEQLQAAQRMEAVGRLSGGIAHDFNNLLGVVLGNLDMLLAELPAGDPLRDYVDPALRAAGRGAELTQRLLAFGRRQALMLKPTDLCREIAEMGHLLERTMPSEVVVEVSPAAEPIVAAIDPGQLETAILNLALNARDAMPDGGRLRLLAEVLHVRADQIQRPDVVPAGRYATIRVEDTGTGMSMAVLSKCLEPFFTTKPASKGTGLGLSMVYGFVRQSGGYLQLESIEGTGTTFRILFPMAPEAVVAAPAVPRSPPTKEEEDAAKAARPRVLLVDDMPDVRSVIERMLRASGYDVMAVGDGKAALAVLDGPESFDAMLTDLGLPNGISGMDLVAHASQCRPDLRVATMSGYAEEGRGRHALQGEGRLHLNKPMKRSDLEAAMKKLLAGLA